MNDIKIKIKTIVDDDGNEFLNIEIMVDEILLTDKYCVDYSELIRSVKRDGEYFVLTCSCGVSHCAGIYKGIAVKFMDNFVEWHFIDPYWLEGKTFIFDRNLYVEAIRLGFQDVRNILKNALLDGKRFCVRQEDLKILIPEKKFLFNLFGINETIFLNSNWRKTKRYSHLAFKRIEKSLKHTLGNNL